MAMMTLFEKRATTVIFNLMKSLRPGKAFIIPANICPIVPIALCKSNVEFEIVDISEKTLCVDEDLVREKFEKNSSRYAGLIFSRTYGTDRDFKEFFSELKSINENIFILDDRCLSIPSFSEPDDKNCDLTLYSTGYSKVVDIGWGGFGFLNREKPFKRIEEPYSHEDLADIEGQYKERILIKKYFVYKDSNWLETSQPDVPFSLYKDMVMAKLGPALDHKNKVNGVYSSGLPEEIQLPENFQTWRFNILVPRKDILLSEIARKGFFASSHYASLGGVFSREMSPVAERFHRSVVNLFNDFRFDEEKAAEVVKIIKKHLDKHS